MYFWILYSYLYIMYVNVNNTSYIMYLLYIYVYLYWNHVFLYIYIMGIPKPLTMGKYSCHFHEGIRFFNRRGTHWFSSVFFGRTRLIGMYKNEICFENYFCCFVFDFCVFRTNVFKTTTTTITNTIKFRYHVRCCEKYNAGISHLYEKTPWWNLPTQQSD